MKDEIGEYQNCLKCDGHGMVGDYADPDICVYCNGEGRIYSVYWNDIDKKED